MGVCEGKPPERVVYLVMTARGISSAMPLTENLGSAGEIKMLIERMIEHLPPNYNVKVKKIAGRGFLLH